MVGEGIFPGGGNEQISGWWGDSSPIPTVGKNLLFYEDPPPTFLSVALFIWLFFGWMGHHATFDVPFYLMTIWIYTCRILVVVPEESWYVFYETRSQVYWGPTHNVVSYWYSDLIWHTHKHKHTQLNQGPADWHTYINTYNYTTCYVLTAATFITLMIKWIIHWYRKFTFHNVFPFQKLFTCKSHVSA